ncbi:hypothetical protein CLOM_g3906 [Closterium sp. NIES-68]|nr:hypothetical protein CLOM_g3906 [Closterium sp. NIES-68]GJP66800.1 hypothetical protein CLOP_g23703 [Closterium sp. NIES-67]
MDWFHYVLLSVNLCLLVLVIAETLPPWVTGSGGGAGNISGTGLAAAGGAGGRFPGEWGALFPLQLRKSLLGAQSADEAESSFMSPLDGTPASVGTYYGASSFASASDGSAAQHERRRVCWTSSGDYASPSPSGVVIHGAGCATCLRGQRCSFRVSVRAPARWAQVLDTEKESWWKRDLTLTLRGAALAHGDIRCLDPPHCTELRVSYRVWDIGEYWATLHVGCANLNFSSAFAHHFNQTQQHNLGSWPITVVPRVQALSRTNTPGSSSRPITTAAADSETAGGRQEGESERAGEGEEEEEQEGLAEWPENPCVGASVPGRWVADNGSYSWAFYRCSAPEVPASGWIAALHRKGIKEISIVGDSHQRFLAAHLYYLLTAEADKNVRHWQDNLVFEARDSSNRTLRINFYWIDGIYRNGEFGCSHRGATTNRYEQFPNISTTADVTLFEGGYWAASFCRQPLKALRVHLEEFARWALAAAPPKGRVVFRTIPSFPVSGDRCNAWYPGPSSNRVVMAINVLLKHVVEGRGVGGEEGQQGEGTGRIERVGKEGRAGGGSKGGEGSSSSSSRRRQGLVYLDASLQQLPLDSEDSEGGGNSDSEDVDEAAAAGMRRKLLTLSASEQPPVAAALAASAASAAATAFPPAAAATSSTVPPAELVPIPAGAATVLDTWQVDGPRYFDTAHPNDHHYSMVEPTEEGAVVVGEVGEAQVRAFIHYLLNILPPQ